MAFHWLLTGKTIGDLQFWPRDQIPDRFTAMHICTSGSSWFTDEETLKGKIVKGIYAAGEHKGFDVLSPGYTWSHVKYFGGYQNKTRPALSIFNTYKENQELIP